MPAPSEPRIEKIAPAQRLAPTAGLANDDAPGPAPAPPAKQSPASMLFWYRHERGFGRERRVAYRAGLGEEERAATLAKAAAERRAEAEGHDRASPHAAAEPLLAPAAG